MKKKAIARCTPTLGMVSMRWARAIEELQWPMNTAKLVFPMIDRHGGEIAEVRNEIVEKVLTIDDGPSLEVTDLFWLDDDVITTPLALRQLLEYKRTIAAGTYFTKSPCAEPLIFPSRIGGTADFVPNKTVEVWGCGMGLTLVKTSIYRMMKAELDLGTDKYGRPAWYRTTEFEGRVEDGLVDCGGTEDLYFCENAAKLGLNVLVDMGMWAFGFHYDARRNTGYPAKQWEQYSNGKPVTWQTPDGEVRWE